MDASGARVVLVHDWLTGMRGGEKCLEVLCRRLPSAPLYTLLHEPGSVSDVIERRALHTSFLQYFPTVSRYYRYLLPMMPAAASGWRLPACDVVVSLSHCVAKAAQPPRGVPHVCYCFTPMRYAWHMRSAYLGPERLGTWKSVVAAHMMERMRRWDQETAARVTHFLAISRTVQARIAECYGRSSEVIYPPVDTDFFFPVPQRREGYYLAVSAFAPYKRLDLAIAACNHMKRQLVIIGNGQDEARLRAMAGPTVHFLGWQPDVVLRDHLRRCRALLFPGEEDFGIVPVEAQACGAPVIGYGRGGLTETVVPIGTRREPTGVWFERQTVDDVEAALAEFEAESAALAPVSSRRQALRFTVRRFEEEIFQYLNSVLQPREIPERRAA